MFLFESKMAYRETTLPQFFSNKKKPTNNAIREPGDLDHFTKNHNAAVLCRAQPAEQQDENRIETNQDELSYIDVRIVIINLFIVCALQ